MSDTAQPPGIPPAADTQTATTADEQPASLTDMNNNVVDPVNHATRDPKFSPGAGQAFFSTELGTRAPRSLGPTRAPVIARSVQDPAAVVQAATHWQVKYKNQCLCILPSQGWTVEDLWDAEDVHIEGKKFCEEMLTFISRNTYYAADRFAKDWALTHPDRVDFIGLQMGNVYDINDPLAIVDQIFVFGEPLGFPRVFLWHVAHILITTWIEMNKATNETLRESLTPQARTWGQQSTNEAIQPSSTLVEMSTDKKGSKKNRKITRSRPSKLTTPAEPSSAIDKPDHVANESSGVPDQPNMRYAPPRIPSQGLVQRGGHSAPLRSGDMGVPAGPSRPSPNMHALSLNIPKSNRNMNSGSYVQQHGWVENNNRTAYGPYPRQPSGAMPAMQSPHFLPPQMALGQHIAQPMMSGVVPYVQVVHHGFALQHPDPGLMSRAQLSYQQNMMNAQPINPIFTQQPHSQHVSMGDMTNNMMLQHQDPRAPVPRRSNPPRNPQELYDPYGGNNPKFNGAPGHNNIGRKGGNSGFAAQSGRGRKVSNPGGRESYNRSNADYNGNVPSSGPRYADYNNRRRPSEDDPAITGDSVSGCGHTWIGPKNQTVTELWIGDLLPETGESEIAQMFKQTIGISPIAVSLRGNKIGASSIHAFATFVSTADASVALGINKFNPHVRGVRPVVTVPRRFYQRDVPSSSSYFDQSHTGRDASRMSIQKDDKPVTDVESNAPTESAKASYSPQDARSGLLKKPSPQSDVPSYPETGDVKLEMPKHQQKSPTKKNKGKGRRESTVKNTDAADEKTKATGKLNSDGSAVTKEEETGTKSTKTITEPTKPATVDGPTSSAEEHKSSPSESTPALDQRENEADASTVLPRKDSETLEAGQDAKTRQKERDTDVPLNFAGALAKNLETRSDATSIAKDSENTGGGPSSTAPIESPAHLADNDISDDEAKNDTSFHSAPEIQPESVQAQPQPELQDKAMTTNHETTKSPSIPTETSLNKSPTLITPRNTTQSDSPVAAPPKEDTAPQLPISESTQDPTTTATAQENEEMSTAAEISPVTATKKAGAQQMQSLHPFAKSNKSQAKREKEARKKQQRKEDADRVAKAKADKAISSQKPNDGPSAQRETGSLGDSLNSPGATDTDAKPEAANSKTGGDSTTGNKKSKGKAKMQPADTSSVDGEDKAVAESENGKPNGNINDSKDVSSVTHQAEKMEAHLAAPANQGSSGDSGVTPAAEPTPSTLPFAPSVTPKAQGSSQKMPAQEVNDPHNFISNQQTHVPGHSRRSSASTLVGEERVLPSAFTPPAPTHPDSSRTVSPDETPQLDATPTVAPKKKKKKPKKKKTAAVLPSVDPDPPIDGDYHNYNPFSSQMSHIDAIRRANKYDTTSFYAVTNARMERDAEESRRAARALADLNEHAS